MDHCLICGSANTWLHDHKPDNSGLDDGPYLPGCAPRKKSAPKPAHEVSATRKIAVIEAVALEQLAEHEDQLSAGQRKVIADQIAREAWRRLNQDLQNDTD